MVLSWPYSIFEAWKTYKLIPFFFKYGVVIKEDDIQIPKWTIPSGEIIHLSNGVIKVLSENECLFHTKFFRGFVTPFPLKGILRTNKDNVTTRILIPNGATGFVLGFLLVFLPQIFQIRIPFSIGELIIVATFIFVTGLILGSCFYELKIYRNMIEEFKEYL